MCRKNRAKRNNTYRKNSHKRYTGVSDFERRIGEIDEFCREHDIRHGPNYESYYFTLNGERYRVSSHSQSESDRSCFRCGYRVRKSYHNNKFDRRHDIRARRDQIIEVYESLRDGTFA